MRGDFLHNQVLLEPIAELLRERGIPVFREFHIGADRRGWYADLAAVYHDLRLLVEAERSADRVNGDVAKALAWPATHLLIVAPHRQVMQAVARRLGRLIPLYQEPLPKIYVATLGIAKIRLKALLTIVDHLECPKDIKSKKKGRRHRLDKWPWL